MYVPIMIKTIAMSFNVIVPVSISSFKTLGRYFVIRVAKSSVKSGEISTVAETSVIGPSDAA